MIKQIKNYILQEKIGEGNYGLVFKAKNTQNDQIVAIKQICNEKFQRNPKLSQFVINEIQALSQIDNINIIKYLDFVRTQSNIYIVYDFCNGGSLQEMLQSKKKLNEKQALIYYNQILNGLKTLNEMNVIHRDLKPGNILFHNGVLKIADFGFCKSLQNEQDMTQTMLGSPVYMAPEILKGETYSIKADIWSLGVVLYEMIYGKCPFEAKNIYGLIVNIQNQQIQFPPNQNVSKLCENLIKSILISDHTRRLDLKQLLQLNQLIDQEQIKLAQQKKIQEQKSQFTLSNITNYEINNKQQQLKTQKSLTCIEKQQRVISSYDHKKTDKKNLLQILKCRNKLQYCIQILGNIMKNNDYQKIVPSICGVLYQLSEKIGSFVFQLISDYALAKHQQFSFSTFSQ